jgi:UPF0716 protein FxsA
VLPLLFAFTVIPFVELMLLVRLGGTIGFFPTLAICLLTGVVGAALARSQGLSVLRRIQEVSAQGQLPTRELLDGAMILLAGMVLITPGFLTDAFGLFLLTPPGRAVMRVVFARGIQARMMAGGRRAAGARPHPPGGGSQGPTTVEPEPWVELAPGQEVIGPGQVRRPWDDEASPVIDVEPH